MDKEKSIFEQMYEKINSGASKKKKVYNKAEQTICWKCDNGYAHKCKWIARGATIDGWEIIISDNTTNTYRVVKCPNFEISKWIQKK